MLCAVYLQVMNLGVEGLAYLACRAREVNDHAIWIDQVDRKAVRPEPPDNLVEVFLGETVPLTEFLCGQPSVEARRGAVVELIEELLDRLLLLGGASQLE